MRGRDCSPNNYLLPRSLLLYAHGQRRRRRRRSWRKRRMYPAKAETTTTVTVTIKAERWQMMKKARGFYEFYPCLCVQLLQQHCTLGLVTLGYNGTARECCNKKRFLPWPSFLFIPSIVFSVPRLSYFTFASLFSSPSCFICKSKTLFAENMIWAKWSPTVAFLAEKRLASNIEHKRLKAQAFLYIQPFLPIPFEKSNLPRKGSKLAISLFASWKAFHWSERGASEAATGATVTSSPFTSFFRLSFSTFISIHFPLQPSGDCTIIKHNHPLRHFISSSPALFQPQSAFRNIFFFFLLSSSSSSQSLFVLYASFFRSCSLNENWSIYI